MKNLERYSHLVVLLVWLSTLPSVFALLEERFVAFSASNASISIQNAVILHDAEDPAGVQIAVQSLADDFEEITGTRPQNITWDDGSGPLGNGTAIIIGTVESQLIKIIAEDGKIDVDGLQGKWETFQTSVVSEPLPGVRNALVIVGSDMRGTAFGVYTLAEQCGQSPFHFWADVPAVKHETIYALSKTTIHGEPTVKYRGLFINDEAPGLTG